MLKCQACSAPLNPDGGGIIKCRYCGVFASQSRMLMYNLSIETWGDEATVIIPKQTFLPYVHSEVFSTAKDYQKSVEIHLVQGDSELASKCRSLGKFRFEVFPLEKRAVPQIEVFFSVSSYGELKISAVNLKTERRQEFQGITLSVF